MVLLSLLATGLICSVLRATSVRTQIVVLVALIGVAGTLLGALVDCFAIEGFIEAWNDAQIISKALHGPWR